ncbi:MAG: hypothetical protein QOD14_852 [Solirubrobacterales bacterium]|jgi:hypothetical protein|nr:hypothetical protein [Solirubrobacterales bacterium]
MLTFKVFRNIGDPSTYMAVGHDGPRALVPSVVNTFATSIPVQAGDVIGLNDENATAVPNACIFSVPGETALSKDPPGLADGESSAAWIPFSDFRHNITAEVSVNAAPPTGQRAAALKSCKKRAHKHHWSHKRLRKCRRKANLLPI